MVGWSTEQDAYANPNNSMSESPLTNPYDNAFRPLGPLDNYFVRGLSRRPLLIPTATGWAWWLGLMDGEEHVAGLNRSEI